MCVLRISLGLFLLMLNGLSSTAYAQANAPQLGSYRCFTFTGAIPTSPAPRRDDPGQRKLEHGERYVPPQQATTAFVVPAFFGNVELLTKETYRLSGRGSTGGYRFDQANEQLSFTGDLSIMKVSRFDSTRSTFFITYQTLSYQCSLAAANAVTPPTLNKSQGQAITSPEDLTGRFVGSYACNQTDRALQLDLKANAEGLLVALLSFGGTNQTPKGSYTLQGSWEGSTFKLDPVAWVSQPSGFRMTALIGQFEGKRLTGFIVSPACKDFIVTRE